jgi:hypothetical protein
MLPKYPVAVKLCRSFVFYTFKMNGQDHGPIGPGDRIKLTDKGVLTVNGAERKAAPKPEFHCKRVLLKVRCNAAKLRV